MVCEGQPSSLKGVHGVGRPPQLLAAFGSLPRKFSCLLCRCLGSADTPCPAGKQSNLSSLSMHTLLLVQQHWLMTFCQRRCARRDFAANVRSLLAC